jgi:hypothetical protein
MAESLKMEHCFIRTDVLNAIHRQPYTNATIPFVQNTVPGIIFASDYDLGKNGFAYSDVDYENTTGSGTWNNGWQYRNDGVDIEQNSDFPSNGYDVGWINSGEFLNITATVAQTGTYAIGLRAAAGASGGKVILKRNGVSLTSAIDIPLTGGWQNWETVNLGQFQLTAGVQTFGLYFFFGGFNVNYLEFTQVPNSVSDTKQSPRRFALSQNYPNPFNPGSDIGFQIGKTSWVTLKVYNILGQEVATLVNEQKDPGSYTVRFDASRLPSGVYMCTLNAGTYVETRRMILMR